jgi:hypothetical protein
MLNTNKRTIRPIATMKEALIAILTPFRRLSILGTNWRSLKDLKARIVLRDSKMLVAGKTLPKISKQDGKANRTRMKSNLFHPSDQYPRKPRACILTTASNRKSKVNKLSMIRSVPPCPEINPLIKIMPVLIRTNTSIMISFVKKRFIDSIYT